jgi:hypothetical protein
MEVIKTELFKIFLTGLFFSLSAGTILNIFISIGFFISNKKNYNEYTWKSFVIPSYMLIISLVIGITIQFVLGGF